MANSLRQMHPVEQWVQHITKTTPDLILGTLQHADLDLAQQLSNEMQRRGLTTQDIARLKNRKQPVSTT